MNANNEQVASYVDAAGTLLGVAILPEWRAGVAAHLAIILASAEFVAEFECTAATEPAPLFEASRDDA